MYICLRVYIYACIMYMSMYVYVFYVCLYGYSNVKCVCVCTCVCVLCIIYHVSCTMYQVSCITYHAHVYACTCMFVHTYYVCVENRHTYVYCIYYIYTYTYVYNSGKDKSPCTSITILAFLGMQNDRTKILSTNKCHCPIDQHTMYPNLQWEQMLAATCNYQHEGQNIFKIKRTASKTNPT